MSWFFKVKKSEMSGNNTNDDNVPERVAHMSAVWMTMMAPGWLSPSCILPALQCRDPRAAARSTHVNDNRPPPDKNCTALVARIHLKSAAFAHGSQSALPLLPLLMAPDLSCLCQQLAGLSTIVSGRHHLALPMLVRQLLKNMLSLQPTMFWKMASTRIRNNL